MERVHVDIDRQGENEYSITIGEYDSITISAAPMLELGRWIQAHEADLEGEAENDIPGFGTHAYENLKQQARARGQHAHGWGPESEQ